MSNNNTKVIFDENLIEKYKKKAENKKAWLGRMLPFLVVVIFAGAVTSFTLLKTRYSYIFDKEQKIAYLKTNGNIDVLVMANADGSEATIVDTGIITKNDQSDALQGTSSWNQLYNQKAHNGIAVYDKVSKQLLYLKDLYISNYDAVGALKLKNFATEEIESIENDVVMNSIYYNEKGGYCIFEKVTNDRQTIDLMKLDFRSKNKLEEIASGVKKDNYFIFRDSGRVVYLDNNNYLYMVDGKEVGNIDGGVEGLNNVHYSYDDESMHEKFYYTKRTTFEPNSNYSLCVFDITKRETTELVSDISKQANVLPDGTYYYTRDTYIDMPYTAFIDVNSNVNDLRKPSTMTKEKLAGIDFIVYKNNIYDVSDIEKVEEVQAKYNVELEDYQLKVERYNEFLGKISSDFYQYLYKDIYYFDGVKEYKLNQGNVSSVNYFDGGVFFKIDKEFPIIPLKLSDIINSGYTNLNDPINNLISEKKGCYYVYKGLDGFSHADLNTIMNNSVEFVNVDKRGYINIAYTNYEKDTVYYSLKTVSPDYNRVEDEVEKNKYTRISRARITSDNKYEMYKQYIGKNGLMTQIGRDDARLNVSFSNNQDGIYLSNNDYNINEEIILFKTDYNSSSNSIGTLYAYNNKTNKSSKLADNVRAAIVYNDNEGLYITANNNGTYDLRYGKNIINNSIDCIVDLSGNISKERRLKPIDLKDKKKKSNKKEEVEEEIIPYVATKSYLVAGRDYSEQQAFEIEIPFMEKTGFETLEDGNKMYNKGNLKYARNEWVDVGPFRYHFDASGIMEVSKWIDDLYYVNHVGVMVKNTRTPDGFRVDANGELIDDSELKRQAEILAARTTQEEKNKKNSSSNSSSSGSKSSSGSSQSGASSTTQQKSTKTANANATLNTNATEVESSSRKFYVSGYKLLKSYVAGGSGYDCDIYINYPIISSKDEPEEASLINQAIQDELEVMRVEAEGVADAEDILPRQYVINKAKVSTISTSKVVIVLSGAMAIPGKTNKTVKMTITYDREDESADVS